MKVSLWRCHLGRVLALAVVIALLPLPAMAGDAGQKTTTPGIRASAAAMVKTEQLAATPAPAAQAQSGAADTGSPSFFKRPVGIAVLVTLAAGVGYALYSTSHDRIHSAGKK